MALPQLAEAFLAALDFGMLPPGADESSGRCKKKEPRDVTARPVSLSYV